MPTRERIIAFLSANVFKLIAGAISLVTVVISTAFAVDGRYARVADLTEFKQEQNQAIIRQGEANKAAVNNLRRQMIEDKIFEIELINPAKRTDYDRAKLDKYKRDLKESRGQ